MHDEPVYVLTHDVSRFEHYEDGYRADLLIDNDPLGGRLAIYQEERVTVPTPVIYRGYPPILRTLDFPVADNSWLVMSQRMLHTLKSAGEFRHLEIPIIVADYSRPRDQWRNESGFGDDMVLRNFSAIQLLGRLDVFDFERSKYTTDPDFPDTIGDVDEYVFKIPDEGLPPIFHLKGQPVKAFVSQLARTALKKAGITGVAYVALNGMRRGQGLYVDVPVPMPEQA